MFRHSTSAQSIRWCLRCGRRTIRRKLTALSGWLFPQRSQCFDLALAPPKRELANSKSHRDPRGARRGGSLPPLLKGFNAVPPLITDINLSLDDRFLYVSCWGTGEMLQYDVSDPFNPKKTGSVQIGGILRQTPHPAEPEQPLQGGPQMVEVTAMENSVYFTNSLYAAWDEQFPNGGGKLMAKLDVNSEGGLSFDKTFFVQSDDYRVHQIRLEGGDSSSDSFCYP